MGCVSARWKMLAPSRSSRWGWALRRGCGQVGCPRGTDRQGKGRLQQGDAVAGQNVLFDHGVGGQRIVAPVLLHAQLDLPALPPLLDDNHAPAELRKPLLQHCHVELARHRFRDDAPDLLVRPSPLRTIVSSIVMVMDPVEPSRSVVARASLMSGWRDPPGSICGYCGVTRQC